MHHPLSVYNFRDEVMHISHVHFLKPSSYSVPCQVFTNDTFVQLLAPGEFRQAMAFMPLAPCARPAKRGVQLALAHCWRNVLVQPPVARWSEMTCRGMENPAQRTQYRGLCQVLLVSRCLTLLSES